MKRTLLLLIVAVSCARNPTTTQVSSAANTFDCLPLGIPVGQRFETNMRVAPSPKGDSLILHISEIGRDELLRTTIEPRGELTIEIKKGQWISYCANLPYLVLLNRPWRGKPTPRVVRAWERVGSTFALNEIDTDIADECSVLPPSDCRPRGAQSN